jgi:uncharacterized repeat protein (TIGR01451 family)
MSQCDGNTISSLNDSLSYSGGEIFAFVQDGVTRQGTIESFIPYLSSRLITKAELDAISIPWDEAWDIVIQSGGQSKWDSNFNLTNLLSSWWTGTANVVEANQTKWNDDITMREELQSLSGEWDSTTAVVQSNSASWAEIFDATFISQVTGSWDSTYNTVSDLSTYWNNTIQGQINTILGLSADWQEAFTVVSSSSAQWDSVVDLVECQSWDDEFITVGITNIDLDIAAGDTVKLRSPYSIAISEVRASVNQAPIGSDIEIDILNSGLSMLNSSLVIDDSQTTSTTSSQTPVLNTRANVIDNSELTISVQSVGSSQAGKGLKITLIGNREGCVDNPAPSSAIRVINQQITAPTTFIEGDIIQFNTIVTNTGGETVGNVIYTNSLPINITEDLKGLSSGNKTLAPDESVEVKFNYTVTANDVTNWLTNATPVTCRSEVNSDLGQNLGVVEIKKFIRDGALSIVKTFDSAGSGAGTGINGFKAGDRVYYDVVINNSNAVEITGSQLFDSLSITVTQDTTGITQSPITIPKDSNINVRYYYTVTQTDVDNYETNNIPVTNTANVQHTRAESESNTVTFNDLDILVEVPLTDVIYFESTLTSGTIFTLAGTSIANGYTYSFRNIPPITTTFVSQGELPVYPLPELEFLTINDVYNSPVYVLAGDEPNSPLSAFGSVPYIYQIGKYAVTSSQIEQFNNENTDGQIIPISVRTEEEEPAILTWNHCARYVNWLNKREGYQEAYKFNSTDINANTLNWEFSEVWKPALVNGRWYKVYSREVNNYFRHKDAKYFIPSEDEWFKAAFYDPDSDVYYTYTTGSDDIPISVSGGVDAGTVVYKQPANAYAEVRFSGGLSPYGTMGQGGNGYEWCETPADGYDFGTENDEIRVRRGGPPNATTAVSISNIDRDRDEPTYTGHTLRIAANPIAKKKVYDTDAIFTNTGNIPNNGNSTRSAWLWPATSSISKPDGDLTHISLSGNITILDVTNNPPLIDLDCKQNKLTTLDITNNVSLTSLNCNNNDIGSLDVSINTELLRLRCVNNEITTLDISANTKLTELNVSENNISDLNVDTNINLEKLLCNDNNINALDVQSLSELGELNCADNNINTLTLSACTKLTDLTCDGNNNITTLDVLNNQQLVYCSCPRLSLTDIDLSQNTELEYLQVAEQLDTFTTLDITANTKLWFINANYNQLASIDLTNNINTRYLSLISNQLTTIDLTNLTELHTLYINNNQLTNLDVGSNPYLYRLGCHNNNINAIDFTNNTVLEYITCTNNNITSIDVQNQPGLQILQCGDNLLSTLNVSGKDKLTKLLCEGNNITTLNINNCISMIELNCSDNNITTINAVGWIGSNVLCDWSNNQLTSDELWSTFDQAGACDPLLPTIVNISGNPAVVNGVLQDGIIHTASEVISKATGKNYALQLS